MASPPPHPSPPTAHSLQARLVSRYLGEWGRSILRAPGGAAREEIHLVYVVGFAGEGLPRRAGEGEAGSETGAEVAAIRALDALCTGGGRRGRGATATALLVEEDPVLCERLLARLQAAGYAGRLRESRDPESAAPGEIVVVNAGFRELAPELHRYTAGPRHALYFLDPPSPATLPLRAVAPLVQQEDTELVLVFPGRDLHRQAPYRGLPVADLPPHPRRIVEGYSEFFGDRSYEWVMLWRAAEREGGAEGGGVAEARMLEHYRARLAAADPQAAVRWVPVAPPESQGNPLYLFLATHDPERALLLNRVLHTARREGEVAWGDALSGYVREEETGVLDLFAAAEIGGGGGAPTRTRVVNLPALAHEIANRFAGRTVPFREVLLHLADTDLFVEEIRRAMSLLRREGRASYDSLAPNSEIVFAA